MALLHTLSSEAIVNELESGNDHEGARSDNIPSERVLICDMNAKNIDDNTNFDEMLAKVS